MSSQLYLAVVGSDDRPRASYAAAISRECPHCGAAPYALREGDDGRKRTKMPCVARLKT